MKAERLLEVSAKRNMKQWNQKEFKKTHPSLYKSIVDAIQLALAKPFCLCIKQDNYDHDEDGQAYCINCNKYLKTN